MGLRSWLRARLESRQNPRALGAGFVAPAPVLSGTYVTPQTALGLSAYYAAVNVISRDVASLPLNIYRRLPGGGREIDESHPYQDLLTIESDDNTSSTKFSLDTQGHTLGWGNGYAEIVRDRRGTATSLHIMHPAKTYPKVDDAGRLFYEDEITHNKFLPENILHFAGLGFNGITGYTPAYLGRQGIGLGIAAEQFGASLFGNGLIPKGIIKLSRDLSPTAKTNLRTSMAEIHQGSQSAHQLMILEEGMEYEANQINPDDAQFLATRQFQVLEIARLFGLPPHKLQDYSQAHLANVEESNLDYLFSTLAFWCFVRERELNRRLLTREDRKRWVIAYDFSALLRGNSGARVAYYNSMRNMGCLSADDIRKAEGLNPLGTAAGGDKYLVQMQYQPLAKAGEPPAAPAPAAPPAGNGKEGSQRPLGSDGASAAGDRSLRLAVRLARRLARHNPHHTKDGRFGHSPHSAEGKAAGLGEELADHEDPASRLAEEYPRAGEADPDFEDDARAAHADLMADQAGERKQQEADHKEAARDQERDRRQELKDQADDHKQEAKELERDQKTEVKDLERDHKRDVKDLEKDQAGEREELQREQAGELEAWVKSDPHDTDHHADVAGGHAAAREELAAEHAKAREELAAEQHDELAALKSDHAGQMQSLLEDHAQAREEMKKQHASDREYDEAHRAQEAEELAAAHREARRDWVEDKALEAHGLEQELEPEGTSNGH